MDVAVDVLGVEALELDPVEPGVAGPATDSVVVVVDWSSGAAADTGRIVAEACDERSV